MKSFTGLSLLAIGASVCLLPLAAVARQSATRVYTCGDGASVNVPTVAREITVQEYAAYPALFVTRANTLDPVSIVRDAWKGYLTHMCTPWGLRPGGDN